MNPSLVPTRSFIRWSGVSGMIGVVLLVMSFIINPGLPGDATGAEMVRFARQHYAAELWGAWLQAVGPVFIVLFAFSLVHLAGAMQRLAGWMTVFGATTLMTVSLIEITFYLSGMFAEPELMPVLSIRLVYAVQHLYFMVAAPALFLPLGLVLLGSRILPRAFGYLALGIAIAFGAAGVVYMLTLRLPDLVTASGAVQPIWWLAAAIMLIARSERLATGRLAKS